MKKEVKMDLSKPFPIYQLMDAFEAFTHGEPLAKPQHRSLYYYLLGRARKLGNVTSYTLPYENGMHGSGIGSWATYDAALKALAGWGFIEYTPGANRFKTPVVAIQFRNPTDDVLLTYWQSYCLSTCSPIDNSTGDNNRLIDLGKKRIKELETSNDAANTAAQGAQKKIDKLEAQLLALQPASPLNDASHTRGAADVPTRKPASRFAYDPADIHPGMVLPFDTAEFRVLWASYRQYREEQKLPRFNGGMQEQEALRHLSNLAADHATATAIISQTIRNGWKNLFKLDEPRPQSSTHSERGAKPTAAAATGARALAIRLAAIDEEQRQERLHERRGGLAAGAYTGQSPC